MPDNQKDSALILGGNFRVFRDGRINRIKDGVEHPATIYNRDNPSLYLAVSYSNNGKQVNILVHRLVATAFIPNPHNYPCVNHLNGNKHDNAVANLEWVTHSMNTKHAYRIGLINPYSQKKACSVCGKRIGNNSSVPFCQECFAKRLKVKRGNKKRASKERFQFLHGRDKIIMDMWADGETYQKIGERFGISKQRACQIVQKLLKYP